MDKKQKYSIELTDQDRQDLVNIRTYFGENDDTIYSHYAFKVMDDLVKDLTLGGVSYCTTCKENRLTEFNKEMEELRQKYKDILD